MSKKEVKKTKVTLESDNSANGKIIIRGARTHNLKNIDVEMPRGKMIAITGPSGSGKSSLAFDTIFAEGQRINFKSQTLTKLVVCHQPYQLIKNLLLVIRGQPWLLLQKFMIT